MVSVLGSLGNKQDSIDAQVSKAVGVPTITSSSLGAMSEKQLIDLKSKLTGLSVRTLAGDDRILSDWEANEVAAAQRKAGMQAAGTAIGATVGGLATGLSTGGMGAGAGMMLGGTAGGGLGLAASYLDPHEQKRGAMSERQQNMVNKSADFSTAITKALGLVDAALSKKQVTRQALTTLSRNKAESANRWVNKA